MKNILENKIKFFAQYYGQIVLRHNQWDSTSTNCRVDSSMENCAKATGFYLELKPLLQISDEDAYHLGKFKLNEFAYSIWDKDKIIKRIQNEIKVYGVGIDFNQIDYLRSKGYALPWNSIPVEEQIEFGWIKIKES